MDGLSRLVQVGGLLLVVFVEYRFELSADGGAGILGSGFQCCATHIP